MKIILIYSGGLDSTVLLYHLRAEGHDVKCLTVDYGQRHRREIDAARAICARLGVEHRVADLGAIQPLLAGSALTSLEVAVPEGHYAEESMKQTVVPNRNMILLATGIAWAVSSGAEAVAYAAHGGDHAIYPDCRPEFVAAMAAAARLCDWRPIEILTPFIRMDKAAIVARGAALGAPFQDTWTCYQGQERHCGVCGSCTERREAFLLAHIPDPTEYEHVSRIETA
ncbi:MAG: 7-cyano-7-deazaguanine synthase QueC [Candidatus Sumerlaeota bacterium]|nr:7-cyano-7-deazaguanine synthase QueC [Candidatus Sumerlaeota bacterium]